MDYQLEILHEDNHIIVVNKRAGDLVQGDKTGDIPIGEHVKSYIKKKYNKPGDVFLGVVHRLDRPVSGIVVFARTSKALSRLNEAFRDKEVEKTYWAVVEKPPEKNENKLCSYLAKNAKQNKSYIVKEQTSGAKLAILSYKKLISSDKYHLLSVNLETGRHHQIRTQLAGMGCIIKGDLKYGAARSNKDASICLHARHIAFTHPVTKVLIELTASTPKEPLWDFFERSVTQ